MDFNQISQTIENRLNSKGLEKACWEISESELRELNAEKDGLKLYRTIFGSSLSLTVFSHGKKGCISGTDLSDTAIAAAVDAAAAAAETAPEDDANDLAPKEGRQVFKSGSYEPDEEGLLERCSEFLNLLAREHPLVVPGALTAEHRKEHSLYCSTNGSHFECFKGSYAVSFELAGSDGKNTTGIDCANVIMPDLSRPFMECGGIAEHVRSVENQLKTVEFEGKFEGTVIFTPDCLAVMLGFLKESYLGDRVVLDGTGLWNSCIGTKVTDEKLSMRLMHSDRRIVCGKDYTADGFVTRDLPLIEKGILKNQQISLYTANRTGRQSSGNDGFELVVEPGGSSIGSMIAGVERGLLVGGFSGGEPGANGEFSGVAKNSFLIENGRIVGAAAQTMISGSLAEMFRNIQAVSCEVWENGYSVTPYMAVGGIIISGR